MLNIALSGLAVAGCGGRAATVTKTGGAGGHAATGGTGGSFQQQTFAVIPTHNQLDLLFVIDDSGNGVEQYKLAGQLSTLMAALTSLPDGTPDLHVAVVTTDLGGPSTASFSCSPAGDAGAFQTAAQGSCRYNPILDGASFLAQNGKSRNFTDDLATDIQCLLPIGRLGCPFAQPLAAAARALGADGKPAPSGNAGFLRPNAALGIIVMSHQDDCSTPDGTPLYSLVTGQSSLAEPLGPLTTYRCNRYGHLCADAGGNQLMPPLTPPDGGQAADLTNCTDNATDSGLLIPVDVLVQQIRSLKADPDHDIAVSAIVGPVVPYGVHWLPAQDTSPNNPDELWPAILHSCGAAGGYGVNPAATQTPADGSFGDPAVRIAQFTGQFAQSAVLSVCDGNYGSAMAPILTRFSSPAPPTCIDAAASANANGQPTCSVVQHVVTGSTEQQNAVPNCDDAPDSRVCWYGRVGLSSCPAGAWGFSIEDATLANPSGIYYAVSCPLL